MNLITINGVRGYIDENGTAQLNLEDISRGLGFTQQKNGVEYIRRETVQGYLSDLGFSQLVGKAGFVPENVFYRLAMKARNETAEAFQAKVADEILPSIRKHGAYMTPQTIERTLNDPDFIIGLATRLKEEQTARLAAEAKLIEQRPMMVFAESLQVSKDTMLVAELAKLLKQNGIDIGATRLFERLRNDGYLIKGGSQRNLPTQKSMELGLMEIKIGSRASYSEGSKITKTPKITGKGQMYFINKYRPIGQEA